jgi:hypothetical protein
MGFLMTVAPVVLAAVAALLAPLVQGCQVKATTVAMVAVPTLGPVVAVVLVLLAAKLRLSPKGRLAVRDSRTTLRARP